MARDEADIIGRTVAHLINQGARVVMLDNGSVDGTGYIARELGALVLDDPEPAYYQAHKMTALAEAHAEEGEWVIPFDADEVWLGLDKLSDDYDKATASTHVHVEHSRRALMNEHHPKVAFRWRAGAAICMGNHNVERAGDRDGLGLLTVCHYQYRTLEQVKRKVRQGTAAFDLTTLKDSYGSHWRELAALDDEALAAWWTTYQGQQTTLCQLSAL
jgi:hypothetical protein